MSNALAPITAVTAFEHSSCASAVCVRRPTASRAAVCTVVWLGFIIGSFLCASDMYCHGHGPQ
ncbi:MAG: hypothetical protein ACK56F_01655, partial [bacterium]